MAALTPNATASLVMVEAVIACTSLFSTFSGFFITMTSPAAGKPINRSVNSGSLAFAPKPGVSFCLRIVIDLTLLVLLSIATKVSISSS